MLKLIIHAGLHKTGTTTFQHICCKFADFLLTNKIYYQTHEKIGPKVRLMYAGTPQHSYLAWELQKHDPDELRSLLNNGKSVLKNDGTILISGEDFENCLVDHEMARTVERVAKEEDIDEIEWIFVHRRPFDYLKSLYAQLAEQGLLVKLCATASSILQDGYFKVSAPAFDYYFAFDYKKLFSAFRDSTGASIKVIDYKKFCEVFPGHILLEEISEKSMPLDFIKERIDPKINLNPRIAKAEAEFYYICTRFGIKDGKRLYQAHKKIIDLLLIPRLYYLNRCEAKIERAFAATFGTE